MSTAGALVQINGNTITVDRVKLHLRAALAKDLQAQQRGEGGARVGRGGSRVKTLPPARHFPLQLPPDSPDSFVAFPCELEPQNRRKMPRRGRGKKRKGEKKEGKKGLRYLFRLSIVG